MAKRTGKTDEEQAEKQLGGDEVQAIVDDAEDKGYVGVAVDPIPNAAYSQETDPAVSPSSADRARAAELHAAGKPVPASIAETAR